MTEGEAALVGEASGAGGTVVFDDSLSPGTQVLFGSPLRCSSPKPLPGADEEEAEPIPSEEEAEDKPLEYYGINNESMGE